MPAPRIAWRAYQIQIPKVLADRLERAVDTQAHLENRPISMSEFMCWALLKGLNAIEGVEEDDGQGPDA